MVLPRTPLAQVLYSDSIVKFFFNCIDASLRDIGPDAQDVREVCDINQVPSSLNPLRQKCTCGLLEGSASPLRVRLGRIGHVRSLGQLYARERKSLGAHGLLHGIEGFEPAIFDVAVL
jgi:hypothetical protein